VSQTKKLVAIFLTGMGILLSFAQPSGAQWVQAGRPGGGWITALAVSGPNLFAVAGAIWTQVNSGLPPDISVYCLAVSETDLFAGTEEGEVWRLPLAEIASKKWSRA
jgi:hypothetical protein